MKLLILIILYVACSLGQTIIVVPGLGGGGGGGGAVSSVFGRTGAVTAATGDYSAFYGRLGSANAWTAANTYTGSIIATGVTRFALQSGTLASIPATCIAGDIYFATDATAGANIYQCAPANTWNAPVGGVASVNSGALSSLVCSPTTGSVLCDINTAYVQTLNTAQAVPGAKAYGAGTTFTIPAFFEFLGGKVQNGTATIGFSYPTSTGPTALAVLGTNAILGVSSFTALSQAVQDRLILPDDWVTGASNDLVFRFRSSATSGNIVWNLQTACTANTGVVIDPSAWNTAQTVTVAAQGTTLFVNTGTISTVTTTGCSAGQDMFFKVALDASSTVAMGTVDLISVRFKLKRLVTTL